LRVVVAAFLLVGCHPGSGGGTATLATGVEVSDLRACDDPQVDDRQRITISKAAGGYDVLVSAFRHEYPLPDAYLTVGPSDEPVTLVLSSPKQGTLFSTTTECFGVMRVAITGRLQPRQNLYVTYNGKVVGEVGVP